MFKDKIKHLNYVVQRNWEKDPAVEGDLDLFVALEDFPELDIIVRGEGLPFKVDIRTEMDGYYPESIELMLLKGSLEWNGWKIPLPEAHYISLMYHSMIHKPNHPYKDYLDKLFLEIYKPVKPKDEGVYYGNH